MQVIEGHRGGRVLAGTRFRRAVILGVAAVAMAAAGTMALAFGGQRPAGASAVSCSHQSGDTIKDFVGASGGAFGEASNWSPVGVPDATSIVCVPAGKTVNVTNGVQVAGINVAGGLHVDAGVGLTVQGTGASVPSTVASGGIIHDLDLDGVLAGSAAVDLTGTVDLRSGSVRGPGTRTVVSGATAQLGGSGWIGGDGAAAELVIAGTATAGSGGDVFVAGEARLVVASGGRLVLTATDGSSIRSAGWSPSIHVLAGGTIERTGGGEGSVLAVPIDNDGTVLASGGDLVVQGQSPEGTSDGGTWRATLGTIRLQASRALGPGAAVTGANGLQVEAGTLSTPTAQGTQMSRLMVRGARLTGSQTISSSLILVDGASLDDTGTTTIASSATGTIAAVDVRNGHVLENAGSLTWAGQYFRACSGGLVDNRAGGALYLAEPAGYGLDSCESPAGRVLNRSGATVVKVSSTATTLSVPFDNDGDVQVAEGLLTVTAPGSAGSAGDSGSWRSLAGGTLDFSVGAERRFDGGSIGGTGTTNFSGGSFTGTPQIQKLTWRGGTFSGAGPATVTGSLTTEGSVLLAGHLVNRGSLTWPGNGQIIVGDGAELRNGSGGTLLITDQIGYQITSYGTGVLVNEAGGLIKKTTGSTSWLATTLDNAGTVEAAAGVLRISGSSSPLGADTGTYRASATGKLAFEGGTRTFGTGGTMRGPGAVLADKAGSIQWNGTAFTGTPTVAAATVEWIAGGPVAPSVVTIGADARLEWNAATLAGGTIRNLGTTVWNTDGGWRSVGAGAVFANAGTFDITGYGGRLADGGTAVSSGRFVNEATGTVRSRALGAVSVSVPFRNDGTVAVEAGSLAFDGPAGALENYVAATKTLSGGRFDVSATLTLPGEVFTLDGGMVARTGAKVLTSKKSALVITTVTDHGLLDVAPGVLVQDIGWFQNHGRVRSGLSVKGTLRQTSGSIDVAIGRELRAQGSPFTSWDNLNRVILDGGTLSGLGTVIGLLDASATVSPGADGTGVGVLTLSGPSTLKSSNVLEIDIAASGNDRLAAPQLVLGGTLRIRTSGTPATGEIYEIVTGPNLQGSFATVEGRQLPDGRFFHLAQSPTAVTLTVMAAPGPPAITSVSPADRSVTVRWSPPSDSGPDAITEYVVRALQGATVVKETSVGSGAREALVTGLTNGQTYTFTVTARSASGLGLPSQPSVAVNPSTFPLPGAPPAPIAAPGPTNVDATWTQPATGGAPVLGAVVTPTVDGQVKPPITVTGSVPSASIVGLSLRSKVSFRVAVRTEAGLGPVSAPSNLVVVGAPGIPAITTAAPGDGAISIGWTLPADNGAALTAIRVTPYTITGSGPSEVRTPGSPIRLSVATSATVPGLTNGTTYRLAVQAINSRDAGPEAWTDPIVVGAPAAPSGVVATSRGTGGAGSDTAVVAFVAGASNGAPATYEAGCDPVTPGAGVTVRSVSGTGSPISVTGLTAGTAYRCAVVGVNGRGRGPASLPSASVLVGSMAPPSTVVAAPGTATATSGALTVTFVRNPIAVGSAASSTVTCTSTNGGVAKTVNGSATGPVTVTGLTTAKSYGCTVSLANAVGPGAASVSSGPVIVGSPTAPTAVTVVKSGTGAIKVTFKASTPNGAAVTGYTATCTSANGGKTGYASAAASPIVVGALSSGKQYTCRVTAKNARGTGPASLASTVVTT